jgi:hypothetical protein
MTMSELVDGLENVAFAYGTEYRAHGSNNYSPEWREARAKLDSAIEGIQQNAYAEGRRDEAEEHAWRPIETAPEDTNILVATTGGWVDCAFWTDEDGAGRKWWWLVSANEYAKHPLHPNLVPLYWMPLPKHPHRVATTIGKAR